MFRRFVTRYGPSEYQDDAGNIVLVEWPVTLKIRMFCSNLLHHADNWLTRDIAP